MEEERKQPVRARKVSLFRSLFRHRPPTARRPPPSCPHVHISTKHPRLSIHNLFVPFPCIHRAHTRALLERHATPASLCSSCLSPGIACHSAGWLFHSQKPKPSTQGTYIHMPNQLEEDIYMYLLCLQNTRPRHQKKKTTHSFIADHDRPYRDRNNRSAQNKRAVSQVNKI